MRHCYFCGRFLSRDDITQWEIEMGALRPLEAGYAPGPIAQCSRCREIDERLDEAVSKIDGERAEKRLAWAVFGDPQLLSEEDRRLVQAREAEA